MFHRPISWCVQQFRSPKGLVRIGVLTAALGATAMAGWHRLAIDIHRGSAAVGSNHLLASAGPSGTLNLISGATYNFGVMDQEKQGTHKFEIKNDGHGDLVLELLDKSCGCTSVKVNGRVMDINSDDFLALPPLPPLALHENPLEPASQQVAFKLPEADSSSLPAAPPQIDLAELLANLPDPALAPQPTHTDELEATASAEPFVVRPGEKAIVELTWDTGMKSGPVRQYVRFGTSDPNQPMVDFAIEGEVVPVVAISENPIRIPNARSDESSQATFHIFSTTSDTLKPSLSRSSNDLVTARFEPLAEAVRTGLKAKSGYRGIIEVAPGLPVGPLHVELVIATNDPDRPELKVAVFGQVEGNLVVVPSDKLDFQLVPHDKSRTLSLLAKVRSDVAESIKVARITPEFLKFEFHAVKSGNGGHGLAVVEVTVPAGSPVGPFEGAIEVATDHVAGTQVRIPVRGHVTH